MVFANSQEVRRLVQDNKLRGKNINFRLKQQGVITLSRCVSRVGVFWLYHFVLMKLDTLCIIHLRSESARAITQCSSSSYSIKWASLHKSETRSVKRIQGLKKFYLNLKGLFIEFLFFTLNKRIEFRNSCILDKQYIFTFNKFKYFPFKTESIREIQKCSSQKLFFIIEVIKVWKSK